MSSTVSGIQAMFYISRTSLHTRGCRGRNRMVVGFTNTSCAISAYHH